MLVLYMSFLAFVSCDDAKSYFSWNCAMNICSNLDIFNLSYRQLAIMKH